MKPLEDDVPQGDKDGKPVASPADTHLEDYMAPQTIVMKWLPNALMDNLLVGHTGRGRYCTSPMKEMEAVPMVKEAG